MTQPSDPNPQHQPDQPPGLLVIVRSILAAALGVQSSKNRERDFSHGKTIHFIIGGLIFTGLFIVTVVSIVRLVLKQAGA